MTIGPEPMTRILRMSVRFGTSLPALQKKREPEGSPVILARSRISLGPRLTHLPGRGSGFRLALRLGPRLRRALRPRSLLGRGIVGIAARVCLLVGLRSGGGL